ncbi:MAG: restriction endonuclease [Sinobacteraceae bacterium]|nr:restriction endonuclease [Nevskiaceae bacterium]
MKSGNGARKRTTKDGAARHALVRWLKHSPDAVFLLTARQFKELVAGLLTDRGWDIQLAPATGAGSAYIWAYRNPEVGRELLLVQARKCRKGDAVRINSVCELFGALRHHNASRAMIVTTSSFTRGACEFAGDHQHEIDLLDYNGLVSRTCPRAGGR